MKSIKQLFKVSTNNKRTENNIENRKKEITIYQTVKIK